MANGADEVDMVMDIGGLKSGRLDEVLDTKSINSVVKSFQMTMEIF